LKSTISFEQYLNPLTVRSKPLTSLTFSGLGEFVSFPGFDYSRYRHRVALLFSWSSCGLE